MFWSSIAVGFLCTIISHPDDVVKTRQQTRLHAIKDYGSYHNSLFTIARTEGISALFKGAVFRCCLRVPFGLAVINTVHPLLRPEVSRILSTDAKPSPTNATVSQRSDPVPNTSKGLFGNGGVQLSIESDCH